MSLTLTRTPVPPILGNRRQRAKLKKEQRTELIDRPLEYALRSLAIRPFDRTLIEQYMKAKLEALFPTIREYEQRPPDHARRQVRALIRNTAIVIATSIALAALIPAHASTLIMFGCITIGCSLLAALSKALSFKRALESEQFQKGHAKWQTIGYQYYVKGYPVPPEVQKTAEALQRRLPKAELTVHYFYADPFIEIRLGNEQEFVCGWDEGIVF